MNERLAAVFQQLTAFWQGLTAVRRFAIVGAIVAVLGGTLYAANVSNQEQYGFLFTDLSVDDAASITTKLKELKVPFRIAAGGSAIEVPEQRVHELVTLRRVSAGEKCFRLRDRRQTARDV